MSYISIAIDGPAGAGKSTIAKSLAARHGWLYVDTGAIYRTVGLYTLRHGIDPKDADAVKGILPELDIQMQVEGDGVQHMYLDGEDVTSDIRTPEISMYASAVSAHAAVRSYLLEMQRSLARTRNVVMDGRDIGTVVLPHASVKIFLTASAEIRARRRWLEQQQKGNDQPFEAVLADVIQRDEQDTHRAVAPLRQAEDAVLADTSNLNLEESVDLLDSIIKERVTGWTK